jgi:hypothetical protein
MRWYADFAGWGCDGCRQFHPVAAPRSRTALYLGLGAGALVFLVIIVLAATSDDSRGGSSSRKSRSRSSSTGGATYGFKGDSVDDAVEAMRDFRDRMCECRTESCADRVERDYKAFERAMERKFSAKEIEKLADDRRLMKKVERLEEERKRCRDKAKSGDMNDMLDAYERYADRACQCRDYECTRRITTDMARDAEKWAKLDRLLELRRHEAARGHHEEVHGVRDEGCERRGASASSLSRPALQWHGSVWS